MLSTEADADTCEFVSVLLWYGSNPSSAECSNSMTRLDLLQEVLDWDVDCSDEPVGPSGSGGSAASAASTP